jgi:glycosyltransferase involved in cell wall biosynthesis
MMKVSVVIRTYNEAQHLAELLEGIQQQQAPGVEAEVIVVDSGSTDPTLEIAHRFACQIEHIPKAEFSFGRSLNWGCQAATGEALVFVSGHCLAASTQWLARLVEPLRRGEVVWTYGRQVGNGLSRFSEHRVFEKYFPSRSQIPQEGFFCNNANSALLTEVWQAHPFDEELTGLEDMHLARKLVGLGMRIGYVAEAPVYHIHAERWLQVKNRFEREAIALQHIMPEVHVGFVDFLRYLTSAVLLDTGVALRERMFFRQAPDILAYRLAQYWGVYRGNHFHRQLSRARKERYFYPR